MSDTTEEKEQERATLNNILTNPTMIRALEGALSDIWKEKRAKNTIEGSAMAYQYYDGACELIAILYNKSRVKPNMTVAPRRIRHNAI